MRARLCLMPLLGVATCLGGTVVAQSPAALPTPSVLGSAATTGDAMPGAWHASVGLPTLTGNGSVLQVSQARPGGVVLLHDEVQAEPGSIYTGSFMARASGSPTGISASLRWFTADGTELRDDAVRSGSRQDRSYTWTRYTVAGLTPRGAVTVRLGATLDGVQPGAPQQISDSSVSVRRQGSEAVSGPLTTRGNTIRDAHGRVVVLRGLNRPGLTDSAHPAGLTATDIAKIKAWGSNVVRLPLNESLWVKGCSSYDPAYPKAVDRVVDWVTSRGMVALLDLHVVGPTCSSAGLYPLPDQKSLLFWRQVAKRYRSAPLVALNLYNEPYDVSATAWRDGGTATAPDGTTYRGVGMVALYKAVRGAGARNLVLVDGLDKSSTLPSTAPFSGTNLVWSVHAYVCDVPWTCKTTDSSKILNRFAALGRRLPVMITEFGHPTGQTAAGAEYAEKVISYAQARGWGWTAWAWDSNGTCAARQYFVLLSSTSCGTGTGTYQPSPTGVSVLLGLAGTS